MKKSIITLLTLSLILGLIGCGNTIKNEEEIIQDLQNQCDIIQQHDLKISNLEMTNRKTDTKGKSDTVYCTITAQNENMKYLCDYTLNYFLYDQGWILDSIDRDNKQFVPLHSPITLSQVYEDSKQELEVINYEYQTNFSFDREEIKLDNNTHLFYFTNDTKTLQFVIDYDFDGKWYLHGYNMEKLN